MHEKRPKDELPGKFDTAWRPTWTPCPHCQLSAAHDYRIWQSDCGGYLDVQHRCDACGRTWWVDGPDS